MKKRYTYYLAMAFVVCACSDFLEENSKDLIVPKTVEHFKEFLYGEGLNNKLIMSDYLDMMTDDVSEDINLKRPGREDYREIMWSYYTWQQYPEVQQNNTLENDIAWTEYYHRILIANIILDRIEGIQGDKTEKSDLTGEAYFLRAWSYFMLANLYGKPYVDEQSAGTNFCVPINRNTDIETRPLDRASLKDVYALIEEDICHSIAFFKAASKEKTIFRPNLATSYLLASRVALFQKKYDKTILYADSVFLTTKAKMYDLNVKEIRDGFFLRKENPEILFSYGKSDYYNIFKYSASYRAYYVPSASLLKLYKSNDYRLASNSFFKDKGKRPYKWNNLANSVFAHAFRLPEAYLNRAEAYVETGKTDEAIRDINQLRKYRIPVNYEEEATGKENVRLLVRNERRMELCFEGFRWFDLRRWDRPSIVHRYTSAENPSNFIEYVLKENDEAYTLPIPQNERDRNVTIENINRPERQK